MTTQLGPPISDEQRVANAYQRARWAGASQTLAYHTALAEYRRIDPEAKHDYASAAVFRIITAVIGA